MVPHTPFVLLVLNYCEWLGRRGEQTGNKDSGMNPSLISVLRTSAPEPEGGGGGGGRLGDSEESWEVAVHTKQRGSGEESGGFN